jgi:hypothetical protein
VLQNFGWGMPIQDLGPQHPRIIVIINPAGTPLPITSPMAKLQDSAADWGELAWRNCSNVVGMKVVIVAPNTMGRQALSGQIHAFDDRAFAGQQLELNFCANF